nr:unnamed protein product [Callosobruchus analis]
MSEEQSVSMSMSNDVAVYQVHRSPHQKTSNNAVTYGGNWKAYPSTSGDFCEKWCVNHTMASPRYRQSNGTRLFRQATLFFNHRKIVYLIEATKKFWSMENCEKVTKTIKRNSNIYVCLAGFHVWAVIAVVDICHAVGATAFMSYDIMVKHFRNNNIVYTFMVLVAKDMELLNRKFLKCFDEQIYEDVKKFNMELKECVDKYIALKETLDPRILADSITYMAIGLYIMAMIYCIPGQKLADQVELMSQNVYLSNWQDHPKENKDMLIVLSNTQVEFGIRAGALTLLTIIKADHVAVASLIKIALNFTIVLHRMFRQGTLFFHQHKIVYLLEATKKFWPMEDYEKVNKTLKRNSNIYVCLAGFHVISAIIKRNLRAHTSGLYVPKLVPRWAVFAAVDIFHVVGAFAFTSYDIMVYTFMVLVAKDMELLNRKFLKCFDVQIYEDAKKFNLELKECVDKYIALKEFCTIMNKVFAMCMMVTLFSTTTACTVSLTLDPRILAESITYMAIGLYIPAMIYCIPGQKLADQVELMSQNVYLSNWQDHPKENKDMLIVLSNTQVEFGIRAGGLFTIMPYHPEIEFCLKLQRIIIHDPRKGKTFSQWLSFIMYDVLQMVVPTLTLISIIKANHVTVAGLIKIILNITLFGHQMFRQATLFLNQRKLVYLLEATKKFWPMEDYEGETKKLKRNSNIYLCLASFFVKTFIVLVTKDMELLNRKLLKFYNHQVYGDGRNFQLHLRECVDRYNLLREFCTVMNDVYARCMLVSFFSTTFACTVCLYMIMETLDPRILADGIMHMATGLYFMAMFYCVPGQKLANQVEQLSMNAYLSNWEDHPKENKYMLLVLTKTQTEFGIKAGGLIPVNMPTFMAMMRDRLSTEEIIGKNYKVPIKAFEVSYVRYPFGTVSDPDHFVGALDLQQHGIQHDKRGSYVDHEEKIHQH